MEAAEEVVDENPSETDAKQQAKKVDQPENLRVLSVDKVTVEKIVLESATGSREVLLKKNESSRKLAIKSESVVPILARIKDERESTDARFRASLPEDILAARAFGSGHGEPQVGQVVNSRSPEKRIKPIKLTKSPSIGSIVVAGGLNARNVPSKVPDTPVIKEVEVDEASAERRRGKESSDAEIVEAEENDREEDQPEQEEDCANEIEEINAKNRLEKSHTNIEVLQQNLNTQIDANTAQKYKKKLLESRKNRALKLPVVVDSNANEKLVGKIAFDEEFLQKHNLDKRLKIEEYRLLGNDLDPVANGERIDEEPEEGLSKKGARPSYSQKVLEVEKRWSGEFLKNQLDRHSSESSKSSYVEEYGSVSSRESVCEDYGSDTLLFEKRKPEFGYDQTSIDLSRDRTSEEVLATSTLSTVDSDSCLEDRIKSLEEDFDARENETERSWKEDQRDNVEIDRGTQVALVLPPLWNESMLPVVTDQLRNRGNEAPNDLSNRVYRGVESRISRRQVNPTGPIDTVDFTFIGRDRSGIDGYANLIREFTMEAGSSRTKKEEKQKKKLGLRRLLPGFFSPKDSRKDYKKKESKDRKRPDDRHFARYQQNGNYTRSPDTMNLNEDIKRNVKLDNSLNGSIIEERLDEIKRELFPDQGPITSTPDHLARDEDQGLLRDRAGPPRSYTTDSSLSSIAPDERWNDRNTHLGISPDIRKFEQRQKREEFGQRYGQRYGQLERKHSLQEPNHATRSYFFQRNHGPSGRISAPPSERYLVRPRAIHPIDRPLPAIPHSRTELSNYENYLEEQEERREQMTRSAKGTYAPDKSPEYLNEPGLYENDNPSGWILKSVSAQVKITRQPIVNQNHRAPLVGRSPKYLSSGSSQKSGDYGDSSCTPNSSQKSEFSPSSSKSGEYYLHSPRNSGSPNGREFDEDESRREGIYENEKSPSRSSTRCMDERIYDETPSSPCEDGCVPSNSKQLDRSIEDSLDKRTASPHRSRSRGERPISPRENVEKREDAERQVGEASNRGEQGCGPSSPTGNQGKPISPFNSRQGLPASRKSGPSDQILIASPKREVAYETRIPRPSIETRRCAIESPVHMTSTPRKLITVNTLESRGQDSSGSRDGSTTKGSPGQGQMANFSPEIARPEPIYGHRQRSVEIGSPARIGSPDRKGLQMDIAHRKDGDDRVAWVQAHASSPSTSPQKLGESTSPQMQKCNRSIDVTTTETRRPEQSLTIHSPHSISTHTMEIQPPRNPGLDQRVPQQQQEPRLTGPRSLEEPVYVQRICEPYGQRGGTLTTTGAPLSPSKQETRQHLEAFYWQQKALEAHRKSLASPVNANSRQMGRKIDLPEVREAVYWQQLKKLDEEQQRRIYEQNLIDESSSYCKGGSRNSARTSTPRQGSARSPMAPGLSISATHGTPSSWSGNLRCSKSNPTGKPPLMQSQKGQNQPVLIVRPQQAIRERRDMLPSKPLDPARPEVPRSKSASPHFHRGEAQPVPRKLEVSSIYEEEANDVDGKNAPPPPIFKRGSLIGGESVEYGSAVGAKRVSFSNQSGIVGQDLPSGSWPTKHGTAPEPPTRRHRSEDSVSDTDSVFSHQERRDVATHCPDTTEYDADRPLPPLPKDATLVTTTRPAPAPGPGRNLAYSDNRWNMGTDPRRAISPQRMLRQKGESESLNNPLLLVLRLCPPFLTVGQFLCGPSLSR
ncbi:hypothetical protein WN48_06594 [Eufriesea mexicana]|uniref:Uncharacterized protein n=1 Tax=Eufriesea mexicana TaxID=516756 RepID=A0A310SLU6_9HYME|nr:hypothetical protein WN48_06594 [Eufriesea mexicana]